MSGHYALIVPKQAVKAVKSLLEERHLLHKNVKIRPLVNDRSALLGQDECFIIATNAKAASTPPNEKIVEVTTKIRIITVLSALLDGDVPPELSSSVYGVIVVHVPEGNTAGHAQNTLHQAVTLALAQAHLENTERERAALLSVLTKSYTVYKPMLLLPFHTFNDEHVMKFMSSLRADENEKNFFFSTIAQQMQVTHIAVNAPIPALNLRSSLASPEDDMEENVMRSPSSLQAIHGDFGPALPAFPVHTPNSNDFENAFWVSTRQNGIYQVWAPRYTMFSSGNVTEKARILQLASVREAMSEGSNSGSGWTAVDLFAGIGYFAFSYAKAGALKVLCWDLNPWSVEGLRRGAIENKWTSHVFGSQLSGDARPGCDVDDDEIVGACKTPETFLVFSESNRNAERYIPLMRGALPPIRHVNCGMLPSIGPVWKIAVQAVDPCLGGWLHLHETAPEKQIHERSLAFRDLIIEYIEELQRAMSNKRTAEVTVEHIEKVKSVGPRLWHVVVDLRIKYSLEILGSTVA